MKTKLFLLVSVLAVTLACSIFTPAGQDGSYIPVTQTPWVIVETQLVPVMVIQTVMVSAPNSEPLVITATPEVVVPPTPITNGPVANRLKYDETGCDSNNLTACRIAGQSEFPAIFVRRIQSGNLTLTNGIVAIQQLAAAAGVPTQDNWSTFEADPIYATFVWCPSGTCTYPTDTAFPLMGIPALVNDQFKLAIVSAHSPQVPPASITEVSCPVGDCWSAPLQ
jgi:hypothetical protein